MAGRPLSYVNASGPIVPRAAPRRYATCGSWIWAEKHSWIGTTCDVMYPYSPKQVVGFPQAGAMILLPIEVNHTKQVTGSQNRMVIGSVSRGIREKENRPHGTRQLKDRGSN